MFDRGALQAPAAKLLLFTVYIHSPRDLGSAFRLRRLAESGGVSSRLHSRRGAVRICGLSHQFSWQALGKPRVFWSIRGRFFATGRSSFLSVCRFHGRCRESSSEIWSEVGGSQSLSLLMLLLQSALAACLLMFRRITWSTFKCGFVASAGPGSVADAALCGP